MAPISGSYAVLGPENLSSALANDDTGRHDVAGGHAWHDGAVSHTKVVDDVDFQSTVNDRHGVSAHLGGTGLMRVAHDGIADEVFELCPFHVPAHHLALGERPKRDGVANLAAQCHAGYRSFQIVWL